MTYRRGKTAYLSLLVSIALLVIFHLWLVSESSQPTAYVDMHVDPAAKSKYIDGEKHSIKSMTNLDDSIEALDSVNAVPRVIHTGISLRTSTVDKPEVTLHEYEELQNQIVKLPEMTQKSVSLYEIKTPRISVIRRLPAAEQVHPIDAYAPSAAEVLGDINPEQRSQQRVVGARTNIASNAIGLEVPEVADKDFNQENDSVDTVGENLKAPRSRHVQTDVGLDMMSPSDGLVNVVSMSLYGSDPRYVTGAMRNAQLIRKFFPGWQLWIYMESSESSRYPPVPSEIISRLVEIGADVHYITPQDDFVPPMMWRFMVADDPSVDRFIIRDADSRLTRRDSASVAAWIKSGRPFYCVRDHPSHAGYAVSGGLWGGRAPALRILMRRSWASLMRGVADGYLNDMNFLNSVVWPRVEKVAFCTDSVSCDRWTGAVPFPVARQGSEHIGQVYDENDIGRRVDVNILKRTGENRNCVPSE